MYQRQLLGWENSLGSLVSWSELLTVKDHSEVNLNGLSFLADEQSKTLVYFFLEEQQDRTHCERRYIRKGGSS